MNAIVGLCHFCEAHGPRPLFCTFTTDSDKNTTESSRASVQCSGCTSLGPETVFVSREDDGTIYCSRESVPNADVTSFLRQAAIRSITCEVRSAHFRLSNILLSVIVQTIHSLAAIL